MWGLIVYKLKTIVHISHCIYVCTSTTIFELPTGQIHRRTRALQAR